MSPNRLKGSKAACFCWGQVLGVGLFFSLWRMNPAVFIWGCYLTNVKKKKEKSPTCEAKLPGSGALSAAARALRGGCWLAARREAIDSKCLFFGFFFWNGHLAKTSLPSVYLIKYFCLVAVATLGPLLRRKGETHEMKIEASNFFLICPTTMFSCAWLVAFFVTVTTHVGETSWATQRCFLDRNIGSISRIFFFFKKDCVLFIQLTRLKWITWSICNSQPSATWLKRCFQEKSCHLSRSHLTYYYSVKVGY